mmetsp:Transcript_22507/g.55709  ORF Transcript_22507/g.55709 Transcript_22507/m.55709 type:complete len:255 (-) Transcript_22507:71-835(-)|eukprot:CAMPEP_0181354696 /NCGR_PEP_ID=MMETSP1106-20121128/3499_1 /TAXON_ID=81844 /ORGANISM="Mantoniella antarctica, Strain SL-175" /LENGTH=254 /DNA_ID=CAMNT_0023467377 /DNA_START=102 /DNA_END=866 /DNA_ORIENTATION=-
MASAPTPSLARTHLQIQSWPAPASPAPPETWTLSVVSTELGAALRGRKQRVAVSEVTTGGLLTASLLSLPGASSYFTGSAVAYSPCARVALVPGCDAALAALEKERGTDNYASPERYYESRVVWAISAARDLQRTCSAGWGVAEVGAAGPTFHPATGAAAGFTVIAVCGPPREPKVYACSACWDISCRGECDVNSKAAALNRPGPPGEDRVWVRLCETGHAEREENMWQFAAAAAELCRRCVDDDTFLADNETP